MMPIQDLPDGLRYWDAFPKDVKVSVTNANVNIPILIRGTPSGRIVFESTHPNVVQVDSFGNMQLGLHPGAGMVLVLCQDGTSVSIVQILIENGSASYPYIPTGDPTKPRLTSMGYQDVNGTRKTVWRIRNSYSEPTTVVLKDNSSKLEITYTISARTDFYVHRDHRFNDPNTFLLLQNGTQIDVKASLDAPFTSELTIGNFTTTSIRYIQVQVVTEPFNL